MTLYSTPLRTAPARGFSLIEMLVVVVIIGVLAAIAYPAYANYLIKGNRAAAQSYLMELALAQQQYLADNRTYADTVAKLNLPTPTSVSEYYTIGAPAIGASPPTFSMSAVPVATKRNKDDGTLTITHTGAKTPANKW